MNVNMAQSNEDDVATVSCRVSLLFLFPICCSLLMRTYVGIGNTSFQILRCIFRTWHKLICDVGGVNLGRHQNMPQPKHTAKALDPVGFFDFVDARGR